MHEHIGTLVDFETGASMKFVWMAPDENCMEVSLGKTETCTLQTVQ